MARWAPTAIRAHPLRTLTISILQMQTRVTGQGLANTTYHPVPCRAESLLVVIVIVIVLIVVILIIVIACESSINHAVQVDYLLPRWANAVSLVKLEPKRTAQIILTSPVFQILTNPARTFSIYPLLPPV